MYEGKNIHYSRVDNKPLCSFSAKVCKQRRLNGFGFCVRHILEDPNAPFLQCAHESKNTQQRCSYPVSKAKQQGYCSSHMQVLGIKPGKSRERTKAMSSVLDSKLSLSDRLIKSRLSLLQRNKSVTQDPIHDPDDPYAFPDVPDTKPSPPNKAASQSPAHATAAPCPEVVSSPATTNHKPVSACDGVSTMAKLYPELVEKLERTKFKCEPKAKGSAKTSRTLNRLQNKIAQNKIKDKLKKTQVDASNTTTPESCHTPTSQAPPGVPQFSTLLQSLGSAPSPDSRSPQHNQQTAAGNCNKSVTSSQVAPVDGNHAPQQTLNSTNTHLHHFTSASFSGSVPGGSSNSVSNALTLNTSQSSLAIAVALSPHSVAGSNLSQKMPTLDLFSGESQIRAQLSNNFIKSGVRRSPSALLQRLDPASPVPHLSPHRNQPQQQQQPSAQAMTFNSLPRHLAPFPYLHQHMLQQFASQQAVQSQLHQQQGVTPPHQPSSSSLSSHQQLPAAPHPHLPPPLYPLTVETKPPPAYAPPPPAYAPPKIPIIHTRPKRPKNMLTETEARKKLQTNSAVKVYAYYASQRLHSRDLLPYGVDSSDNDCSDVDDVLPRQQEWFMPSSDEESVFDDQDEDDLFVQRRTKLALLRARIRRQFSQLRKVHRTNKAPHGYQARALQALVESVRENPAASVGVIREIHQQLKTNSSKKHRHRRKVLDRLRPCLYRNEGDQLCSSVALPCTNHCLKHVLYNVDQQVFAYCTAKFADNTQCCVPVFDIRHELPLCTEHAAKADNYSKNQNPEAKPKKPRKKTKPSALTRPPKKGKKKKNQRRNLRPQKPIPPSEPVGDAGLSSMELADDLDMDQSSPEAAAESTSAMSTGDMADELDSVKPLQVATADLSHDLTDPLSPGTIDKTFGDLPMPMDNDQTKFLDEHDLHEVLNKLPEEAFDIFAGNKSVKLPDEAFDIFVGKNGEFLPTREETEELERALAAASKEVTDCQETLKSFTVTDMNLIEDNSNDDEITKQIADSILNETLSPGQLGGSMPDDLHHDNLSDITSTISANELKSFSQVLQKSDTLIGGDTMTYTTPQGQVQGQLLTAPMLQGVVIPQGHLQVAMNPLLTSGVTPVTVSGTHTAGVLNTLSAQLSTMPVQIQQAFQAQAVTTPGGQFDNNSVSAAQRIVQVSTNAQPSPGLQTTSSVLVNTINRPVWTNINSVQAAGGVDRIITPITFSNSFPTNAATTFPHTLPQGGASTAKFAAFSPQNFTSDPKQQDRIYQVKVSSSEATAGEALSLQQQQGMVLTSLNGQSASTSQMLAASSRPQTLDAALMASPQQQTQILAQQQQQKMASVHKDT